MSEVNNTLDSNRITEEYQISWKDLKLDPSDIYLSMGIDYMPDEKMKAYVHSLEEEVSLICKPRALYSLYHASERTSKNHIGIENYQFRTGPIISSFLCDADLYAVFVVTSGREFAQFQHVTKQSGDIFKEFVSDCLGTAIAEACVRNLCAFLERKYGSEKSIISYPYSPGYCGWHVSQQQLLFSLLPESPCDVTLTPTSLMLPIKSVSGVVGIGKNISKRGYGCEICNKADCYKNRNRKMKHAVM